MNAQEACKICIYPQLVEKGDTKVFKKAVFKENGKCFLHRLLEYSTLLPCYPWKSLHKAGRCCCMPSACSSFVSNSCSLAIDTTRQALELEKPNDGVRRE